MSLLKFDKVIFSPDSCTSCGHIKLPKTPIGVILEKILILEKEQYRKNSFLFLHFYNDNQSYTWYLADNNYEQFVNISESLSTSRYFYEFRTISVQTFSVISRVNTYLSNSRIYKIWHTWKIQQYFSDFIELFKSFIWSLFKKLQLLEA